MCKGHLHDTLSVANLLACSIMTGRQWFFWFLPWHELVETVALPDCCPRFPKSYQSLGGSYLVYWGSCPPVMHGLALRDYHAMIYPLRSAEMSFLAFQYEVFGKVSPT